jgi:hypothetical protein
MLTIRGAEKHAYERAKELLRPCNVALDLVAHEYGDAYAWAIENPHKVAYIVGRNPALRSLMTKSSPLENLEPLAKAMVPLLHVCDKTDPWFNEQTKIVEQRYKELGGEITVIVNEKDARSPLASATLTRAVDFILHRAK